MKSIFPATVCCMLVFCSCSGTRSLSGEELKRVITQSSLEQKAFYDQRISALEDKIQELESQLGTLKAVLDTLYAAQTELMADEASPSGGPQVLDETVQVADFETPAYDRAQPVGATGQKYAQPDQLVRSDFAEPRDHFQAALTLHRNGRYKHAAELFGFFADKYPEDPLLPAAMYWQAECFFSLGQYDRAIIGFQRVVAKYPEHDKAQHSLLGTAYSYRSIADKNNARFYFLYLMRHYPGSAAAVEAEAALEQLSRQEGP